MMVKSHFFIFGNAKGPQCSPETLTCNLVNVKLTLDEFCVLLMLTACFVVVAIAMDDAKGSVGSGHFPDRTSKPFTTKAGFAVPGAYSEGTGIRFTHAGHCKKFKFKS